MRPSSGKAWREGSTGPRLPRGRVALIILSTLLALGIAGLLAFGISSLPVVSRSAAARSCLMALVYVTSTLALTGLMVKRLLGASPQDCRLLPIRIRPIWAVVAIALPATVIFLLSRFEGHWVLKPMTEETLRPILVGGIAAPIVEEVLFRGVLMTALELRYSKATAIVAPSVLFAALHLVNGLADAMSLLLLMVACTVVGSLLSLITYESGSIVNAVLVHAGWNLATGVILFNGSEQSHYLASYQLTNNQYLWLGGHYAIDASPIVIACYVLVVVLALFLMRRQRSHAHLR